MPQFARAELTTEDRETLNKWIADHWRDSKCAMCGNDDWAVAPSLVAIPFAQVSMAWVGLGSTLVPHVLLMCTRCGRAEMINAAHIGIAGYQQQGGPSNG